MPTDLADLKTDSGDQVFADVPDGKYSDTGASYVTLTDTDGDLDDTNVTLLAEYANLASGNSFGIFDQNTGEELELFTGGTDINTSATVTFDLATGLATNLTTGNQVQLGNVFGFYIDNGNGNKYFSDPDMNASFDPALIYDTVGTSGEGLFGSNLVVAFEDQANGDGDFNDIVVGLTDVAAVAEVPEPGTLALFGMGLLGMGAAARRKSAA
ncbi:PEP-CTERM sorting domain-containing protein [Marinobacter fonticola]|uniref:PEP-CTERM sorting domain-containing protein n=1 Tax=Marinobacter fonticola TaxID=2603215 RepID=UPI00143DFC38|nr:PEP-CTERM sorting domain-containing protein [Marinobacter fonticola]